MEAMMHSQVNCQRVLEACDVHASFLTRGDHSHYFPMIWGIVALVRRNVGAIGEVEVLLAIEARQSVYLLLVKSLHVA